MVSVKGSSEVILLPLVSTVFVAEPSSRREVRLEAGPYVARLAVTEEDRLAAYRLRFLVFNLEMNEGLESAYVDGYDKDRYDEVCDHLLVEERATGTIVGTYRLQMGDVAGRNFGYYSEQEFCFAPYERMRSQIVELGRACIHRDHRSPEVLNLLWRGIARYALANGGRYMMGCCSLNSLEPQMGHAVHASLQDFMVEPELLTRPTPAFAMPGPDGPVVIERAPKLLRAYLAIGAKICGEPAIDYEFRTIDFLTLLDLQTLHPRVAARFLERC
ncbi:GNAT family N-acetyltransferase [Edaphobacter albus]|uniref:GNAT family N-acetyltransferase n=1 Tax=Edaphobacter sp. 4G125 TaxID=2763071 RepID=UPI001647A78E|nr:GNAT family N-acyltransferase [Edaphobacter sp. 4G125]QNI38305.1 GNAT family N-acetyltransferase [Edaphobacter sp. 4G125]